MKVDVKVITRNALIAAVYVALTLLTYPISFMGIQVRLAEILVLLCFFRKDYALGLTLGCLISNSASFHPLDMLIGTIATLLSCIGVMFCKHLCIAILFPVVLNGAIIGIELNILLKEPLWFSIMTVAIGELIAMSVGYILFMLLKKNKRFFELIDAKQNLNFKV